MRHSLDELQGWTHQELVDAVQTLESELDDNHWNNEKEKEPKSLVLIEFLPYGYRVPSYVLGWWDDSRNQWRGQYAQEIKNVLRWQRIKP